MFPVRPDRLVSAYDDDWEDIPTPGAFGKWVGGIIVPLLFIAYGISCLSTHHGVLWGDRASLDVHGPRAVALAIVCISLGVFLHCHYFWGNLHHLSAMAVLGKIVSMIGFIGGLGYLIVQIGIFGRA